MMHKRLLLIVLARYTDWLLFGRAWSLYILWDFCNRGRELMAGVNSYIFMRAVHASAQSSFKKWQLAPPASTEPALPYRVFSALFCVKRNWIRVQILLSLIKTDYRNFNVLRALLSYSTLTFKVNNARAPKTTIITSFVPVVEEQYTQPIFSTARIQRWNGTSPRRVIE